MKTSQIKNSSKFSFAWAVVAIVLLGLLGAPLAVASSLCSIPPPTDTYSPAPSQDILTNVNGYGPVNIGNVFESNVNGTVCALGLYAGNSYASGEWVGLYDNATSTLLTSTTVTTSDPVYDGYYWNPTAPAPVIAGDYYTVVVFTGGDVWGFGAAPINNWGTFTGQVMDFNGSPDLPVDGSDFPTAFYGGDALLSPEPGTLLLFGSGLLGMAGALRRKHRRS
jgi:hypothetical protein